MCSGKGGRAWGSCMTMNDSWGYQAADDAWKTPEQIVRNLGLCPRDGGNYLLNIGPRGNGSIPEDSVRILTAVGGWMQHNGQTIYQAEPCRVHASEFAGFTRQGNTLRGGGRIEDQGAIGETVGQRPADAVRAGAVP